MIKHKIVSLFSGAGGLDLGFALHGSFSLLFANDVLLPAAETYSRAFGLRLERSDGPGPAPAKPFTVLAGDVGGVDFSELAGCGADVLLGGPPCQDFSIVRGPDWDRRGISVKRGRLYLHFVRALEALQPAVFVFENVPGLVSANRGLAYRAILSDFSQLGRGWSWAGEGNEGGSGRADGYEVVFSEVVDFSKLGVPQRRERLLVIGVRRDLARAASAELPELKQAVRAVLRGEPWLFGRYPLTPIEVFEGRRLDQLGEEYRNAMKKWEGVWEEVCTERARRWRREVWGRLSFDIVEDYLRICGGGDGGAGLSSALKQHEDLLRELGYWGKPVSGLSLPDSTADPPRENRAVAERMRRIPPGENHEFVRGTQWEVEGKGMSLVYRRIHPLKPSYTVVAYGGGGTHGYHYDRDRAALTLREKARLQTFPDAFLFSGSRAQIRAQIGEAVPPLAGLRIAEAVALLLKRLS